MGSVLEKNSSLVRKRIEEHKFEGEDGEEYGGSEFNGFGDYFRRKKIKLQNRDVELRAAAPDAPQIFKGIVAHVTGYTQPPLHILHQEIVQHGGGFLQYLDSKTMATHIIASTLPPKKSVDFSRYRIVKPAWIVDSVKAGKLLPWSDYRVLDEGPRQKVLKFDASSGLAQAEPVVKQGYREQTDNSFYTSQYRAPASASASESWTQTVQHAETQHSPVQKQPTSEQGPLLSIEPPSDLPSNPNMESEETRPSEQITPDFRTEAAVVPNEFSKNMTSEEHNAWLLSDPRLRESSCANPEFLSKFYAESRLHHLSTWKADLKSSMQRLAAAKGLAEKKFKTRPGARRYILHVDFDSFFCAVSLKKFPEYADKPAVVAHGTGSGSEIASCNYPAREFGVKNGMWMKRALELCPDLKVVPYDFPAYEEASREFYECIMSTGGVVQSVSVDEALVDATAITYNAAGSQGMGIDEGNLWKEQETVEQIALELRKKIKAKSGCEVSVGIGGNILQAKVALRKAKPAGQYHLKPDDVLAAIGELKVEQLPGVAYSIGGKLEEIGIRYVKDIRDVSRERLTSVLGPKTGEKLADYARGIDRTEVGGQPPRKSVSAEVSWGIRFITQQEAEDFVVNLCKELERRLVNEQVKGRHLTVKIMRRSLDAPLDPAKHLGHGKCDTFNKSSVFGVATHSTESISKEAIAVLRSFKFSPGDLRGLGVQMTKLEPLKAGTTAADGSQKRLDFNTFMGSASSNKKARAEAIDDIDAPPRFRPSERSDPHGDPIADDPLTPRKPKMHPAMALSKAAENDDRAKTPLNVGGTQFLIPSNVDPAVVAELPSDIRSKLMAQRSKSATPVSDGQPKSRSESPAPPDILPSQVDADVFNALPDDMKAEVLAQYGRRPAPPTPRHSPRKNQLAQQKKPTTPTKRGGIRSMFGKGHRERDAKAGVVQTSFIPARPQGDGFMEEQIEELDPEFLAELPEDVRKEVIADHRRKKLAQRSGLDAPTARRQNPLAADTDGGRQKRIEFPAPPPKISFASSGVTSTPEIKDLLDAWHSETQGDGPHRADVEVFEKYLVRVVNEERNMEKASTLVKWLDVLVEQDSDDDAGKVSWRSSMDSVKRVLQEALQKRRLR